MYKSQKIAFFLFAIVWTICNGPMAKGDDPIPSEEQAEQNAVKTLRLDLDPENLVKDSKTEKRDSSAQTIVPSFVDKTRDEPFRPIYRPIYRDMGTPFRSAAFSGVRTLATPQLYYDRGVSPSGGQHVISDNVIPNSDVEAGGGAPDGVPASTNTYRVPLNLLYQQQPVQQHQLMRSAIPLNNLQMVTGQAYAYAEPELNALHSRMYHQLQQQQQQHQQQQQQLQHLPILHSVPENANHAQRMEFTPTSPHQFQYILAIPLSYARQLQHQLPAHTAQSYTLPAAPLQSHLSQPVAMETFAGKELPVNSYQTVHYSTATPAADASISLTSPSHVTANAPLMHYQQIPVNMLFHATPLYNPSKSPIHQLQYASAPQSHLLPASNQIQRHLSQQHSPFYVYSGQHLQQHQPDQPQQSSPSQVQYQVKPKSQQVVRIGGGSAKPAVKQSAPPSSATTTTSAPPVASTYASVNALPKVHHNTVYGPPQEQESQVLLGPYHPARVNDATIVPYSRFIPPQFAHNYFPASHQFIAAPPSVTQALGTKLAYSSTAYSAAPQQPHSRIGSSGVGGETVSYLSRPPSVFFGNHLYQLQTPHDGIPGANSLVTKPSAVSENKEQQQQQQIQQQIQQQQAQQPHQQQHQPRVNTPTGITAASERTSIVKYP